MPLVTIVQQIRFHGMTLLLNGMYMLVAVAFVPLLCYSAIVKKKYRTGWSQKLFGFVPQRPSSAANLDERTIRQGKTIWLHGVSVGEINLLEGLIKQIQLTYPNCECVISTTTQTGYQLAREKYHNHTVFYCPLDFGWAVRNTLRRLKPDVLVLGELELWPNLIRFCDRSNIPIAIVNARLSESSFRGYRKIQFFVGPVLRRIALIAAQTPEYAERFVALGAYPKTTHVTGSIKFDGAVTDRRNAQTESFRKLAQITSSDIVFLAGSTQAPEEQMALDSYLQLQRRFPQLRLILVPRHAERFDAVARLLSQNEVPFSRRSQLTSSQACERVLLVDTIGELSAWWGTSSIAFVGGSMGSRGGQNMIEPAAYGAAICFGPNTKNFKDVVDLMMQSDAASIVNDQPEMLDFVQTCVASSHLARRMGERAQQMVVENSGALSSTMNLLSPFLTDALKRMAA